MGNFSALDGYGNKVIKMGGIWHKNMFAHISRPSQI